MNDDPPDRNVVLDLLFLNRTSPPVTAAILVVAFVVCSATALGLIAAENHYAAASNPTGLAHLIANGSSAATIWPGWIAAIFFLIALRRLQGGEPEPPAGRTPIAQRSVSDLRAGLRLEYRNVRIALVAVAFLSVIDLARAVGIAWLGIRGTTWAHSVMLFTILESIGWVAATLALTLWARNFHEQLAQWGAV
jgi:hypothetical protein